MGHMSVIAQAEIGCFVRFHVRQSSLFPHYRVNNRHEVCVGLSSNRKATGNGNTDSNDSDDSYGTSSRTNNNHNNDRHSILRLFHLLRNISCGERLREQDHQSHSERAAQYGGVRPVNFFRRAIGLVERTHVCGQAPVGLRGVER